MLLVANIYGNYCPIYINGKCFKEHLYIETLVFHTLKIKCWCTDIARPLKTFEVLMRRQITHEYINQVGR